MLTVTPIISALSPKPAITAPAQPGEAGLVMAVIIASLLAALLFTAFIGRREG